jgi:hypothetical protein
MAENIRLLPIWKTISLAWKKTKGVKRSIWAAFLLAFLILVIISLCFGMLAIMFVEQATKVEHPLKIVLGSIAQLITFLFQMGLLFLGIKRAFDLPVSYRTVFNTFKFMTAVKLIGYFLLQLAIMILIFVPFLLLSMLLNLLTSDISKDFFSSIILIASSLASLYVLVRMYLSAGFIVDKNVGPLQAIKLSFLSTRSNFLRMLIVAIIEMFIVLISMVPFGIGLIWTIPFTFICYGVVYQTLLVNAGTDANPLIKQEFSK